MITILLAGLLAMAVGCRATHRILQTEPRPIGTNGIEIVCEPPIVQTKALTTIRFELLQTWRRTKKPGVVRMDDGKEIGFVVTLVDRLGNRISTDDLRPNGDAGILYLAATFRTTFANNTEISSVVIKATETIMCRNIEWIEWNPE